MIFSTGVTGIPIPFHAHGYYPVEQEVSLSAVSGKISILHLINLRTNKEMK